MVSLQCDSSIHSFTEEWLVFTRLCRCVISVDRRTFDFKQTLWWLAVSALYNSIRAGCQEWQIFMYNQSCSHHSDVCMFFLHVVVVLSTGCAFMWTSPFGMCTVKSTYIILHGWLPLHYFTKVRRCQAPCPGFKPERAVGLVTCSFISLTPVFWGHWTLCCKKKKKKKKFEKKIVAEKHFWFQIHIICKVRFLDRPSRQARLGICSGNNMICCRIVDVASFGSTVSETIHELLDVESSFWNLVLCHFCWFYCQNMSLYWTQSSFTGLPPEAGLGGACI